MEVRIGVVHTPKELTLESDAKPESVVKAIEDAVSAGAAFVWLEDGKGRKLGIPVDKIGYVEFKLDDDTHKVGFGR